MLTQIDISQLISIEKLHLELPRGTTVVTGETGAGKSIFIEAILLALGGRASSNIVRLGQEKADISLSFDISGLPQAQSWLKNRDLAADGFSDLDDSNNQCILRRVLYADGRSRSYINGQPSTLQFVRELSENLVQIHSQHEQQCLLKSDKQREYLDNYANHTKLVNAVKTIAADYQELQRKIIALNQVAQTSASRGEFIKFQLTELESLHVQEDEFLIIEKEHRQLAHTKQLAHALDQTRGYVSQQESGNILALLHESIQQLTRVDHVHECIANWLEQLNSIAIQLKELDNGLGRFLEKCEINPERLLFLEERMRRLFDIARKHKIDPAKLVEFQKKLASEYEMLSRTDVVYQGYLTEKEILEKKYSLVANELSISRRKAAKKLSQDITRMIRELSLPEAECWIDVATNQEENNFSIHGRDHILFQIKTHPKQPFQALSKVVSGGELSRIALAIYRVTAEQDAAPVLLFDEVDVGIGGSTAEMVGKLLKKLGETHQVVCITHQPQVAALGHHHVRVSKSLDKVAPVTTIKILSQSEKVEELARMLGGVEMTKHVLAHAKEMVDKAYPLQVIG